MEGRSLVPMLECRIKTCVTVNGHAEKMIERKGEVRERRVKADRDHVKRDDTRPYYLLRRNTGSPPLIRSMMKLNMGTSR